MNYDLARADNDYLWNTYGPAQDMTGAYLDQDDLAKLLRNPTKSQATQCYCTQIRYWFERGPEPPGYHRAWRSDYRVREIAYRHGASLDLLDPVREPSCGEEMSP